MTEIGQHAVGACKLFAVHEFREAGVLGLKQPVDVARRDTVACGHRSDRKVKPSDVLHDVGLDGLQSRCTHAAMLSRHRGVTVRPDRQRCQIDNVRCHEALYRVVGENGALANTRR